LKRRVTVERSRIVTTKRKKSDKKNCALGRVENTSEEFGGARQNRLLSSLGDEKPHSEGEIGREKNPINR